MRRPFAAWLVLAGCYAPHVAPGSPCSPTAPCPLGLVCSAATSTCETSSVDASLDAPGDGRGDSGPADARLCFGTGLVQVCLARLPQSTFRPSTNASISTDSSPLCTTVASGTNLDNACVIAGTAITIAAGVTASFHGSRPLLLMSTSTIVIAGTLDVSSHQVGGNSEVIGAGADWSSCGNGGPIAVGGGGYGGSFGGQGGAGGATSGSGASAPPAASPMVLRGGCPGHGGDGIAGGAAGHGGGAVYLIALGTLTIDGVVNASGEGGSGGAITSANDTGGGGGGAGGLIGLDAPASSISGRLFANGGGGGGAGSFNLAGTDGADPSSPTAAAGGGAGGDNLSGAGGAGSVGTSLDGNPGITAPYSGGGGGGGAGVILEFGTLTVTGAVSPPAT